MNAMYYNDAYAHATSDEKLQQSPDPPVEMC